MLPAKSNPNTKDNVQNMTGDKPGTYTCSSMDSAQSLPT